MKKIVAACIALGALCSGHAFAADMAVKAPPPPPVPVYSWTSCYAGGNIGYSWGRGDSNYYYPHDVDVFYGGFPDPLSTSQRLDGVIGGGQIGCNAQATNTFVVGVETDIQASGERGSTSFSDPYAFCTQGTNGPVCGSDPTYTGTISSAIEWFGTVRGRAGVLITPTILVYGTGGLAYGRISTSGTVDDGIEAKTTWSFADATTKVGWTAGAGIEGAIPNSNNWTWRLEYLYIDFGTVSGNAINPDGNAYNYSTKVTDNVLRVGLNYLFH